MKVVDLNVLIYAVHPDSAHHSVVRVHWNEMLNGDETVALPWIVVTGFLRLATNPRMFARPLAPEAACEAIDEWLALDVVVVPVEKAHHWSVLRRLIVETGTAANLVTDAHIAAIALTHDATVVSCDRDFGRFDGLRVENPLRGKTR